MDASSHLYRDDGKTYFGPLSASPGSPEDVVLQLVPREDDLNGERMLLFIDGRMQADTFSSQTWPTFDQYFPRTLWPRSIYAGKRFEHNRTPNIEVEKWFDEQAVEYASSFELEQQ